MLILQSLTMDSRQIAELVESRHDDVKRSIQRLAEKGVITLPPLAEVSNDGPGPRTVSVYKLGKRDSYVVVAQLSPQFTARLVDRWQELEAQHTPALPRSFAEALQLAADQARQIETQQQALAIAGPKASALDRLTRAEGSANITNAAKGLQIAPRRLFAWLAEHRWIYRRPGAKNWSGYQDRLQAGYLVHKVTTVDRGDGTEKVVEQVLVTPKGLAKLAQLLESEVVA